MSAVCFCTSMCLHVRVFMHPSCIHHASCIHPAYASIMHPSCICIRTTLAGVVRRVESCIHHASNMHHAPIPCRLHCLQGGVMQGNILSRVKCGWQHHCMTCEPCQVRSVALGAYMQSVRELAGHYSLAPLQWMHECQLSTETVRGTDMHSVSLLTCH